MFTFTWLALIVLAAGVVALVDGILRLRARSALLAALEIIASALLLASMFFPIPIGQGVLAVVLVVLLLIALAVRGGRRPSPALGVIALILNAAVALFAFGWLHVPGIA